AESAGRVALLGVLLLACPGALRLGELLPDGAFGPLLWAAGGVLVLAVGVLAGVPRLRTAASSFLRTALGEARSVHSRPARALALWGGALVFPALQTAALVLVARALALDVPVAHLALAYLAATVAVALVPTPGGLGSVEAALVVALVAVGGAAAVAAAVVLPFWVVTVCRPVVPGARTLGVGGRARGTRATRGRPGSRAGRPGGETGARRKVRPGGQTGAGRRARPGGPPRRGSIAPGSVR